MIQTMQLSLEGGGGVTAFQFYHVRPARCMPVITRPAAEFALSKVVMLQNPPKDGITYTPLGLLAAVNKCSNVREQMAFVGMSKLAAQSLGTAKAETKHARKDESGNAFK